ncbi:hypothetical protein B0T20DRAFT_465722 [Sordaria brevicollis]|uniref:Uncharacterized protein n=1 Tax=Sordaria brevicollis TaxID=83679 RepID=A0AAE0PMP9_SORBR|nr:hypothetical protein B0T20DRAFT_465722 [Sordaria brevicollis]
MARHQCPDDCEQHKICVGEECPCRRYDGRSTSCHACKLAKTACRPGAAGMCERCMRKGGPHRCNRRNDGNAGQDGVPVQFGPQSPQYPVDFSPIVGEVPLVAVMEHRSPIYSPRPTSPESFRSSVSIEESPPGAGMFADPILPIAASQAQTQEVPLAPAFTSAMPTPTALVAPEVAHFAHDVAPVVGLGPATPVATAADIQICDCLSGLTKTISFISQFLPEHNPKFQRFCVRPEDATHVPFVLRVGERLLHNLLNIYNPCLRCCCLRQQQESSMMERALLLYDVYYHQAIRIGVKIFQGFLLPYASVLAPEISSYIVYLLRALYLVAGERLGAIEEGQTKLREMIIQMIMAFGG